MDYPPLSAFSVALILLGFPHVQIMIEELASHSHEVASSKRQPAEHEADEQEGQADAVTQARKRTEIMTSHLKINRAALVSVWWIPC